MVKHHTKFLVLFLLQCSLAFAQDTTSTILKADYVEGTSTNKNYIVNPSGEKNIVGVTCTSFTVCTRLTSTADVIQGRASFRLLSLTNGGVAKFDVKPFVGSELVGNNCGASFDYRGGGAYKAYIEINSAKVTPDYILQSTSTTTVSHPEIIYPCGSGATATKLVIESTSTTNGDLYVDNIYLGKPKSIASVAQATWIGSVKYVGAASCVWATSTSSWNNFSADSDCSTATAAGSLQAPGTKIPAVVIPNGAPGTYQFVAKGAFGVNGSTGYGGLKFSDGTNSSAPGNFAPTSDVMSGVFLGEITYASPLSSVTVNLQGWSTGGGHAMYVQADNSGVRELQIDVYYYPTQAQTAVAMLNSNFDWQTETCTGSWSTNTTHTCKTARQGSNLWVKHKVTLAGAPTSATLTLTVPGSRVIDTSRIPGTVSSSMMLSTSGSVLDAGTNTFSAVAMYASTTTLTVQYLTSATAIPLANVTQAAPMTFATGDAVEITYVVPIVGWFENQNAPLLVGGVTSAYSGNYRLEAAEINCDAASAITSQTGFLTSVGNRSTTSCALTITSGVFSATPYSCNVTTKAATVQATSCSCSSATACTIYGANADYDAYVTITGPR